MLYLIGTGFEAEDISIKGLEIIKKCDLVYAETYTSIIDIKEIEKITGKKIIPLNREDVEKKPLFLEKAKEKDVCFLVSGEPMVATTHIDLVLRAEKIGIKIKIIHASSIVSAVSETGLFSYKIRSISIPISEKNFNPESFYDVLKQNQKIGLHTLFLLDLKPNENKYLKINEAIETLLKISKKRKDRLFSLNKEIIGIARLGKENQKIVYAKAKDMIKKDFGEPPYCLIIPSKLHFMEEESLKRFK